MNASRHPKRRIGLLFSLVLLAVVAGGWFFRLDIADWYRLRQYQPPAEVVALAEQTTMTDDGRRLFYVTHPQVTGKDAFNANCRQGAASEYSIVLGCYISNGGLYGDIYLYDIQDERLDGVEQVTAAHEMLHSAYDRLSTKERERVDALLLDAYSNLPDGRVKETIAQYEANDPASVPSELHSILGTEVAELSPALEDYYRRYFSNRQAVVGFSQQYEAEFSRREAQVARYDQQLARLKETVETNQRELEIRRGELERQQATLDSISDPDEFNSQVGSYNQSVAAFNALVAQTRNQIDEYNRLVEERNNLALEVQQLTEAINSQPQAL